MPAEARGDPSAAAACALLKALWLPDPTAAFEVLRGSFGIAGGGSGSGGGGKDAAVAALAARIAGRLRSRVAAVLPRAFSRLPLPRAAELLGFSVDQGGEGESSIVSFVAGKPGWEVTSDGEGAGKVLVLSRPVALAAATAKRETRAAPASEATTAAAASGAAASAEEELSKLASYVLQLEAGVA